MPGVRYFWARVLRKVQSVSGNPLAKRHRLVGWLPPRNRHDGVHLKLCMGPSFEVRYVDRLILRLRSLRRTPDA